MIAKYESSPAKRGRGTGRRPVEGAAALATILNRRAPATALRAVPLPRFPGEERGDARR